jgi:hypothetical protein
LGIEHTPFEANFGFSHDLLLPMRPPIQVSVAAEERSHSLREAHKLVTHVLRLHKDETPARPQPSINPHFLLGDKVSVVTKGLFLRRQLNGKLEDIQLGSLTILEKIGANINTMELPYNVRLHAMFHVMSTIQLCPCPTAT